MNTANWIPDLFMKRVLADAQWTLFSPDETPDLHHLYGSAFEERYEEYERAVDRGEIRLYKQMPAKTLWRKMLTMLYETGHPWITFKDACNVRSPQDHVGVVHSSNLCTEITLNTSSDETAVCNLGSINLARHVRDGHLDADQLARTVRIAIRMLDNVVDINYYPTDEAGASNARWRPVGLGVMGLQDVFFRMRLPFDSTAARVLSGQIAEEIYFNALSASCDTAAVAGPHPAFSETRLAGGTFQFELAGLAVARTERWEELRRRIVEHGVRNSLMIAIAPTATIASIAGAYECIEPQVSNLFKRETLSGEFLQINAYLVCDLQERGLWTDEVRDAVKRAEGSVQGIDVIPDDLKALYRTAWELPMRSLIDMAAERGAFIDQSQSLNLFIESPTIGKLSSMYLHAWKQGLKTTYYLRSRPATRITQTTTGPAASKDDTPVAGVSPIKSDLDAATVPDEAAVACSLENPEACEVCN